MENNLKYKNKYFKYKNKYVALICSRKCHNMFSTTYQGKHPICPKCFKIEQANKDSVYNIFDKVIISSDNKSIALGQDYKPLLNEEMGMVVLFYNGKCQIVKIYATGNEYYYLVTTSLGDLKDHSMYSIVHESFISLP